MRRHGTTCREGEDEDKVPAACRHETRSATSFPGAVRDVRGFHRFFVIKVSGRSIPFQPGGPLGCQGDSSGREARGGSHWPLVARVKLSESGSDLWAK